MAGMMPQGITGGVSDGVAGRKTVWGGVDLEFVGAEGVGSGRRGGGRSIGGTVKVSVAGDVTKPSQILATLIPPHRTWATANQSLRP